MQADHKTQRGSRPPRHLLHLPHFSLPLLALPLPFHLSLCLFLLAGASVGWATNWPAWRGPGGVGVSAETDLPDRWDVRNDTLWKVEVPGTSTSTPVVWGDRVFVTSQLGTSPIARRGPDRELVASPGADDHLTFLVLAFELSTGQELWRREIPSSGDLPATHLKHNLASPSPVTDGKRLVTWFSTGQVVTFDLDGKQLWERNLSAEYGPFEIRWGHGSSPVLWDDKAIFACEHSKAYLIALDANSGRNVWRTEREEPGRSYTTPLLIERSGNTDLVVNGSQRIDVYDPATGARRWSVGSPVRVPISSPVHSNGVLYTSRGSRSGPYMAVELGNHQGDVTSSRIRWRVATGAPYVSSLLHYNDLIFMATETGVASAIDSKTGEVVWRERLGGYFSASPVGADGKVYLANDGGEFFVIRASRDYELLSKTSLDEGIHASPVISNGRILIRSTRYLYAF